MRRGRVVAIGSFDGVHKGHAAVLCKAVRHARRCGAKSLAISFTTPPRMILKKNRSMKLLTTPPERELLIKSLGVDEIRFLHWLEILHYKAFIIWPQNTHLPEKFLGMCIDISLFGRSNPAFAKAGH